MKVNVNILKNSKLVNKDKGITLIALIITVVIMLILASVMISIIVNEDGLFSKVRYAVGKNETAIKSEEIWLEN